MYAKTLTNQKLSQIRTCSSSVSASQNRRTFLRIPRQTCIQYTQRRTTPIAPW